MKNLKFKIGKEIGRELVDLIEKAKERIVIVSPWLSSRTVSLITQKARQGVDTSVVTTFDSSNLVHLRALAGLFQPKVVRAPSRTWLQLIGVILVAIGALGTVVFSWLLWNTLSIFNIAGLGVLISILIVGANLAYFGTGRTHTIFEPICDLHVFDTSQGLMHCKVYVVDDTAVVGSPNFTVQGLQKNSESVVIISDSSAVNSINDSIVEFVNSDQLQKIDTSLIPARLRMFLVRR